MRRWILSLLGGFVLLLLLAVGVVYAASERRLRARYAGDVVAVAVPTDAASISRGAHLARAMLGCTLCHGEDLGGHVYADMGALGVVAGPNLTRGRGGIGVDFTNTDWVRALRLGVRADGTSLIAMPSEVFTHLNDADLGALIAYLQQVPPVDRASVRSHFGPVGRMLLATGKLEILVAPKTPRPDSRWNGERGPTAEYGHYVADVSGCHGCHGYGLSGGMVAGPPGIPPASNLTPAGSMARWSEGDFVRVMRTGTRPDGTTLHEFMPWRQFAGMTDDELRALWLYLHGVAPREFGNK